jgi:alpha-L-rhamnosidase
MGLLDPADWQAQWIAADAKPVAAKPRPAHNGYHSQIAPSADTQKWVAVDLGQVRRIDSVRLHPARPFDYQDTPGFLFPVRFKLEVAKKADFSDAATVVNRSGADVANPGTKAPTYEFAPTEARYVRLTATRLGQRDPGNYGLALAEMEVLDQGKNLAKGAKVTSLDSIEVGAWSRSRLVDGCVKPDRGDPEVLPQPATMLRKEFSLSEPIKRATVYVTGLGLYELSINGQRVGDHLLAPEWTRYPNRLQYQTYDVTKLLREGKNALGAVLQEGWYAGRLMSRPALPEPIFRLILRLDVEMADGTRKSIVSDGSWQGTTDGPIRSSGIYMGEVYDARKEMPGWNQPNFKATAWKPVRTVKQNAGRLVAQPNEPIRVTQELSPVKRTEPKPGVYVYDFGQNMVGWCRVKVRGPRGTTVVLRHAEVLNPDGTLYTSNIRSAAQTERYTLRGNGEEIIEPHFTYHGFRYMDITGLPEPPALDAVTGRVFRSASPEVGHFECSNPLINQIMRLIIWVQRGNMEGVPTDCPQRSERFGWMGDIQAFSQTAIFNMDMSAFFTKWVRDIRDSQADDGRFSNYSPNPFDPNKKYVSGTPAWADAGTIVPWRVYQNYADRRMMAEHFDAARRWVDYIHQHNPNLLWQKNRGNDFNDWLNGDTMDLEGFQKKGSAVPKEVLATAFFAHSTEIVAKMAEVLGRDEEAAKYGKLTEGIKKAFQEAYVDSDGRVLGDTQAGYAMALRFDMVDDALRPALVKHLLTAIRRFKGHPSTGIQTTHRMMLELTRGGQHDEAYRLVNLRTPPSWGHMIEMGATTIWERWDGYVKGRGFQSYYMNSFNHWAFGSVGEWMWRDLAGINPDESRPGFKHFLIRPHPVGDLTWVKARYDSIRGPIESDWKISDGRFTLRVVVPANTTATVCVPTRNPDAVTESGRPADTAPGVRRIKQSEPEAVTFEVQSGRYEFVAPW